MQTNYLIDVHCMIVEHERGRLLTTFPWRSTYIGQEYRGYRLRGIAPIACGEAGLWYRVGTMTLGIKIVIGYLPRRCLVPLLYRASMHVMICKAG